MATCYCELLSPAASDRELVVRCAGDTHSIGCLPPGNEHHLRWHGIFTVCDEELSLAHWRQSGLCKI